jgi:hypothetical protein
MKYCSNCGKEVTEQQAVCLNCGVNLNHEYGQYGGKSKIAAGLLGILLGGLGVHKFYMGKIGLGILYLLFCWTFIPAIIGLVEGIVYLCEDDATFRRRVAS